MKRWLPATLLVLLGAALLLLLWMVLAPRHPKPVEAQQSHASQTTDSPSTPATSARPVSIATSDDLTHPVKGDDAPPDENIVPTGRSHNAARISLETASGPEIGPGLTPGMVLENMRSVVRDYGARFGGNPFGNNREITAKLNGANPKQVLFLKEEDGMRINDRGELIDNWATPFFFHQLSGTEMEIRSAGPDHKMWTRDDLIVR